KGIGNLVERRARRHDKAHLTAAGIGRLMQLVVDPGVGEHPRDSDQGGQQENQDQKTLQPPTTAAGPWGSPAYRFLEAFSPRLRRLLRPRRPPRTLRVARQPGRAPRRRG